MGRLQGKTAAGRITELMICCQGTFPYCSKDDRRQNQHIVSCKEVFGYMTAAPEPVCSVKHQTRLQAQCVTMMSARNCVTAAVVLHTYQQPDCKTNECCIQAGGAVATAAAYQQTCLPDHMCFALPQRWCQGLCVAVL